MFSYCVSPVTFHRKECKNLLQKYDKGQDLLLGRVRMRLTSLRLETSYT